LIRVAGLEYAVRVTGNAGDFSSGDLNGEVDYNDCSISIRSDLNTRKQQQTLIHELTHIIIEGEESGKEKADERFVTRVSNILYGILADNQLLADDWWVRVVDEQPKWAVHGGAVQTRGRRRKTDHSRMRK
jgi:hypothetical protein